MKPVSFAQYLRSIPRLEPQGRRAIVLLARATIDAEAQRGVDLYAIAVANGVVLRVLEENMVDVDELMKQTTLVDDSPLKLTSPDWLGVTSKGRR